MLRNGGVGEWLKPAVLKNKIADSLSDEKSIKFLCQRQGSEDFVAISLPSFELSHCRAPLDEIHPFSDFQGLPAQIDNSTQPVVCKTLPILRRKCARPFSKLASLNRSIRQQRVTFLRLGAIHFQATTDNPGR
jgi:hypothetical protein